jgi:hypothetical protein
VIIRLLSAGTSFKGLGRYLAHDADKAPTSNRVEWTHTLNLANNEVPEAINEMLWTYRAADQLKRAAGIRPGSHPLKNPVKHFSLGWDRSDPQTREHMISTVKTYLDHMGWAEHQAVIFCHNDRHPHVHVMLNAVHPETGRALDDGHEWRRSQSFALRYEREQGKMFCAQRLLPEDQREPAPTREAWMKMKEAERQFAQAEAGRMVRAPDYFERVDQPRWQAKEWELLRNYQKDQRIDFFAEGKELFREKRNEVFREVREEFRPEWRAYFKAKRDGMEADPLNEMKADILAKQNTELERRRDEACASLLERRENEYTLLKGRQKEERAELTARQQQGLRSFQLLDRNYDRDDLFPTDRAEHRENMSAGDERSAAKSFSEAARETCEPSQAAKDSERESRDEHQPEFDETPNTERHRVRDPLDAAGLLGLGALGTIANIGERLFDGFMGGGAQARPRQAAPAHRQSKSAAQERKARATETQIRAVENQAAEVERLQAYWQERGRRRGRDRD